MLKPYDGQPGSRKEQVTRMFDAIAHRYDFLNHLLSFNTDVRWRKILARRLLKMAGENQKSPGDLIILDVATGTGDMAFTLARFGAEQVTGLDISAEMLGVAVGKAKKMGWSRMEFLKGDSEDMPFSSSSFDFSTVVFGIRNFENLEKGLSEIHRVLKQDGCLLILEFSRPGGLWGKLYGFYSRKVLPAIASVFTKDPAAYHYLPGSIYQFPYGEEMINILKKTGFGKCSFTTLSGGIASLYIAGK